MYLASKTTRMITIKQFYTKPKITLRYNNKALNNPF